jgi:hypothetical protein
MNGAGVGEDCRIAVTFGGHPSLHYRADRAAALGFLEDFAQRIAGATAVLEDGPYDGLPRLPCERFWLAG